jgi:predicted dehydrogenase/threonine dehydrogenase-like Zn-dependent dehydrogenase
MGEQEGDLLMRQILQNLRNGATNVLSVPAPKNRPGALLIATRRTLISTGTERMLVEFGQANLLTKVRSQPERVHQILDKMRTDGIFATVEAVGNKLDQLLPLGYCNVGVVVEVGTGVPGFQVGDRVVSNGPHAEVVCVPQNLCAHIPNDVADDEAAFTVLGAIALQGIRLLMPTLGERIAVSGLGLLGLMAVQILEANGCQVLGIDIDSTRLAIAQKFGVHTVDLGAGEDPVAVSNAFSQGHGMDAVLITASTDSSEPIHQAAQMCRKQGRIVLVGVTGLALSRDDFYEKELTFKVSCSYGPGRYDEEYEQKGHDYPFGLVRWTEQRNFAAVLELIARKRLDVAPLITKRVPLDAAPQVYQSLGSDRSDLGIVLTYPEIPAEQGAIVEMGPPHIVSPTLGTAGVRVGVIGAGNFAFSVLIPALAKTNAELRIVAASSGTTAALAARKFGIEKATSDYRVIIDDPMVNTVFIATRHDNHASLVVEALRAGKHVFVEKPLALNKEEIAQIRVALQQTSNQQLMVGFNRRFAPLSVKMRTLLATRIQPLTLVFTVNAGFLPSNHWTQDLKIGGGRIVGEGCHFIDFLRFLVGHPIVDVEARCIGQVPGGAVCDDKMTIVLSFADGSLGTVHYFANGSKKFPKERVEVFCEGRILVLDNFQTLVGYDWPHHKRIRNWRQNKGHTAGIAEFVERVATGGELLIPWVELEEITLATFAAAQCASVSR